MSETRMLEVIEDATGTRVQLEGHRLPVTHANDVKGAQWLT